MEYVIKINGKAYRQVENYEIGYNQTWTPGSERDMEGTWNGTILGNFDTVKFSVLPETKQELSQLIGDLRSGFINVEYYDHEIMGMKTKRFYRANYSVKSIYISQLNVDVDVVNISFNPERKN